MLLVVQNIKPILLFISIFGFASLIPTQVISMEQYEIVIVFYLFIIILLTYFFLPTYKKTLHKSHWYELVGFVSLSLIFHGFVTYYIINFVERPIWPFDDRGTSFLLMNSYYVWAKPFDILIQQLLIIWLTNKLYANGVEIKQIIFLFLFTFGSIHIFQILKTDLIIGLIFTTGALMCSVIYPYLILKTRNGYIYNYMIHLSLYNLAALVAWLAY